MMEIEVVGQHYKVSINSQLVCEHTSDRSLGGYIGLQNHGDGDTVWFRSVSVKSL